MRRACYRSACAVFLFAGACALPPTPFELSYTVFPTETGADVLVEVHGGPASEVWVGFGVGPGVQSKVADKAHSIKARSIDGDALTVESYGHDGYRVEAPDGPWVLSYSLDLRPRDGDDVFYRASTRGDDYLVIVGSDAWARFFETAQPLAHTPANRPAGFVGSATVHFSLPESARPWQVATTTTSTAPDEFVLAEHPINSVFALGPFVMAASPDAPGLRLAVHPDWNVLPGSMAALTGDLLAGLRERLIELNHAGALALLMPLPEPLHPSNGLRTAGMVRGQSLLLYAHTSAPPRHPDHRTRLEQAMAVFIGHELFHLYVPSAVAVTRDLSWLSEGWAMQMGRLVAMDRGWLSEDADAARLQVAYRRYQEMGGYRAGSLPDASMGSDSQRDLLYLRGELVFRLLAREWSLKNSTETFERALWRSLVRARTGAAPIDSATVHSILEALVDPSTVRRYVEGQAPLTPAMLGLR